MDQYILMCREAKEIQEGWEPKRGDQVSEFAGPTSFPWAFPPRWKESFPTTHWLPKIEDLMGMILPEHMAALVPITTISTTFGFNRILALERWLDCAHEGPYKHNISQFKANEIWLLFVMHTLYKKSWSGNAWESSETKN